MDLPQPPNDAELKNIIDKLAQFVARNGSEFEQMTKQKQKDNPKFGFLYGGDYYAYYQYKVNTELSILQQHQQCRLEPGNNQSVDGVDGGNCTLPGSNQFIPSGISPPNNQYSSQWGPVYGTPPQVNSNSQPIDVLMIQRQQLQDQIQQSEQNLSAQQQVLMQQQQQEIEEAIKQAEEQKLNQLAMDCGIDFREVDLLLQPIVDSCTKDSISNGKAWIVSHGSLINYQEFICRFLLRKVTEPEATFNCKLHLIYLINDVLHHCVRKNCDSLRQALQNVVIPMFSNAMVTASNDQIPKLEKLLTLWESKHNYFSPDVLEKLKNPSESWSQYQANLITSNAQVITPITTKIQQLFESYQQQHQAFVSHMSQQLQQLHQQLEQQNQPLNQHQSTQAVPTSVLPPVGPVPAMPPEAGFCHPPPTFSCPPPGFPPPPPPPQIPSCPPTDPVPGIPHLPDFSKPPPGYEPPDMKENLLPNVPYYELPAGLMAPLVKLEDANYKPLGPDDIRLPPPAPPSERLLAAVDMFYSPPSHDRPRDSEGWERLGLYEYFKAKNAAKKKKEQDIREGVRERSRSPTPVIRSKSQSRSRSSSPKSPVKPSRGRNGERSKSPSRSHKRFSPERSPSPPNFAGGMYAKEPVTRKIDESNKGHQLLKKMGWSGLGGLGVKEQGIEDPISGGEVRDRMDQYKGVGVDLSDPFETFRKSKGMAFINRMRARAEEKP